MLMSELHHLIIFTIDQALNFQVCQNQLEDLLKQIVGPVPTVSFPVPPWVHTCIICVSGDGNAIVPRSHTLRSTAVENKSGSLP